MRPKKPKTVTNSRKINRAKIQTGAESGSISVTTYERAKRENVETRKISGRRYIPSFYILRASAASREVLDKFEQ